MNEVLEIVVSWVVSTAAIFAVLLWDERRLAKKDDPRLERAWNPASRDSAVIGFGPLAVLLHFIRTRRSFLGVLLAIGWTFVVLAVEAGALFALDAIETPEPPPTLGAFETKDCADLELVVPFYEGVRLSPAPRALEKLHLAQLELAYPGALSMPLVAFRCGEKAPWTIFLLEDPTNGAASLDVRLAGDKVRIRLTSLGGSAVHVLAREGDWTSVAKAARDAWNIHAYVEPLAEHVDRFDFFVRTWVDSNARDPSAALRTDWTAPALAEKLRQEPPRTMAFVFGEDPNEVDLEGRYFWTPGAGDELSKLVAANPDVLHLHWLNLRTYKHAIPPLGIDRPIPRDVRAAAKLYANGVNEFPQYVFRSLEMCLGAPAWQASRRRELQRLLDAGVRVIAFDEFPTAPRWGAEPCRATDHLHRPADFADETRVTMAFVRELAIKARARGAFLTSEEPSAALVPFASGYMDGTHDDPPAMYEPFSGAAEATRIDLFSTTFAGKITPYTRPSPSSPPSPWIAQQKPAH